MAANFDPRRLAVLFDPDGRRYSFLGVASCARGAEDDAMRWDIIGLANAPRRHSVVDAKIGLSGKRLIKLFILVSLLALASAFLWWIYHIGGMLVLLSVIAFTGLLSILGAIFIFLAED